MKLAMHALKRPALGFHCMVYTQLDVTYRLRYLFCSRFLVAVSSTFLVAATREAICRDHVVECFSARALLLTWSIINQICGQMLLPSD